MGCSRATWSEYGPPPDHACWPYLANMLFQGVGQYVFYIKYNKLRQYHFKVFSELTGQRVCWPDLINNELERKTDLEAYDE
jgi:hypothetical protein